MQRLLLLRRQKMTKFELCVEAGAPCLGSERRSYMAEWILGRMGACFAGSGKKYTW